MKTVNAILSILLLAVIASTPSFADRNEFSISDEEVEDLRQKQNIKGEKLFERFSPTSAEGKFLKERGDSLQQAEVAEQRDEPEEQYNIRIRRSLKKKLKRLVIEEEKPMGVILEKMLELYLQHRARQAERNDG